MGSTNSAPRCPTCLSQPRLILKQIENGSRAWWCKECDVFTPLEINTDNSAFTTKFGSTSKPNSFIISQGKRASKFDQKEEEDKEDIKRLTGARAVTIKESLEETYDTTQQ